MQILTFRSALLLLLSTYFLLGPVREQDIVATVFSYTALTLFLGFACLTFIAALKIKARSRLTLVPTRDEHIALTKSTIIAKLELLRLLPFYILTVKFKFASDYPELPAIAFTGSSDEVRAVPLELTFPHRGQWKVIEIKFTLADRFGLTAFKWNADINEAGIIFKAAPPAYDRHSFPIFSSCFRSGDQVMDTNRREGDPFDLKPYNPADGMKKIVWKIFARSGELISRHAEPSITPEGQVLAFGLARASDDTAAGSAIAYLRKLEDLEIQIYFGCEGQGQREIARSAAAAKDLLINSVWDSFESTAISIQQELDNLINTVNTEINGARIDNVLLFISALRFSDQDEYSLLTGICSHLENQGIKPIIFIAEEDNAMRLVANADRHNNRLRRHFVVEEKMPVSSPVYYPQFLSNCTTHGWEVVR